MNVHPYLMSNKECDRSNYCHTPGGGKSDRIFRNYFISTLPKSELMDEAPISPASQKSVRVAVEKPIRTARE